MDISIIIKKKRETITEDERIYPQNIVLISICSDVRCYLTLALAHSSWQTKWMNTLIIHVALS